MSLYACGDTHGDIDIKKLTTSCFITDKPLTKNDYLLVCGDFGGVWSEGPIDRYIRRWYNEKPWFTLFVDGNHENHEALAKYPVKEWNGGKVHVISESILHLMRGQVYTIDGHKIFTMGGAESTDQFFRKEGVSWWASELPSDAEYNEAISNLAKHDNKVDFVFTHCAGDAIQKVMDPYYEKNKLTNFLDAVVNDTVTFDKWFFGHYHRDVIINNRYIALYQRVVKVF